MKNCKSANPIESMIYLATDPMAYRPLLENGAWFSGLSKHMQEDLLSHAAVGNYGRAKRLFSRGDKNCGLYCVVSGTVSIGSVGTNGKHSILALMKPSQWFGEIALFDEGVRTHDADVIESSILLSVALPKIQAMLAENPAWWPALGKLVVEKLRAVFTGLEQIHLLPAMARVAGRLIATAEGFGMLTPGNERKLLALNQEQLGAMLALTRQTVNEILKDLAGQGVVKLQYGHIEILDVGRLRQISEQV